MAIEPIFDPNEIPAKKTWETPEIELISKDEVNALSGVGHDGTPNPSSSRS